MKNPKNALGKFLKETRISAGFSQKEVASRLGYQTPQFVSNWERGVSTPPGRTLRRLAEMYQVSAESLYEVLLDHVLSRTEQNLNREFFGRRRAR